MSKREQTHLRGQRGQAFADKIRDVKMEQLLCVSLDIRKYFHGVMCQMTTRRLCWASLCKRVAFNIIHRIEDESVIS